MGDERFSALTHDPRYRLPSRKEARTAVDPRFGRLFTDQDFRKKASVDRYGRKVKPESGKKELERLYRLDEPEKVKVKKAEREVVGSSEDESEDDEAVVEKKNLVRDPARDGGFSASESEEESSEEEEGGDSDVEAELAEATAGQEQTEDIPMGEVSRRIAAVNLDWDHIRATDIMAVASSFVPSQGRIERVTIYPSEFGRERLEKEELEGPPREIFASSTRQQAEDDEDASSNDEDEEEDEKIKNRLLQQQANEGDEFDTAKLRNYQLERLRYYYAVIECDDKPTAKSLYDAMDGREYLTTANFFDLRFIPDSVSFDDDTPRDSCTDIPSGYKPNEFRTEALTHSKVRLTWDDDDTTRKEVQIRAFSRKEIDENDLQAYIGSDESDADSTTSRKSAAEDRQTKKKRKEEEARAKMRAAFGLADASATAKSKSGKAEEPVGDMQITFTSGLSSSKAAKEGNGVFENEPQDAESTRERYIRKERERKMKRKEKMKAARSGEANDEVGADQSSDEDAAKAEGAEDAGFDDPFFTDPSTSQSLEKQAKKADRKKKREEQAKKDAEAEKRRAELELLMAGDGDAAEGDAVRHFDMREIEKAEKEARRKGKKKGKKDKKPKAEAEHVKEGGFKVDAGDERFAALFESHEYAIDPTNPKFKGTEGMKALLEEGRKKRKRASNLEDGDEAAPETKGKVAKSGGDDVKGLVARLKGRTKAR